MIPSRFHRHVLLAGVLFALGLLAPIVSAASATQAPRPNVIVVMPDDISHADLTTYNPDAPKTPNIDRLGRQSVRLTDFHVSPTCSPTRAALMTGRYNNATGAWHTIMGRSLLLRDEVTMADILRANGYHTSLCGKWHVGDNYSFRPKDRGFNRVVTHGGGGVGQQHDLWGNSNLMPRHLSRR